MGEVDRKTVMQVLRANGVEVFPAPGKSSMVVLAKGDIVKSYDIPEVVGRRMLHYLQRTYQVPIHHFYNPLMAPDQSGKIQ